MNKHKYYDVIVAWANGEKIQYRNLNNWCDWEPCCYSPDFEGHLEWRIKPKTITKRYRMALVTPTSFQGNVLAVDITESSLEDPAEYDVYGFIGWIGDAVDVETAVS